MRVLLATLILLAVVPATKAQPTVRSVETHSADREPHRSGDGGSSRFDNEMRRQYETLSRSSVGECALASSLDDSLDEGEVLSATEKRRRRRTASPSSSGSGASSQAHTDTEETLSDAGGSIAAEEQPAVSVAGHPSSTYLITDLVSRTAFPFNSNHALRKLGHRVFMGQLFKEVSPVVLSAMLNLLFPEWEQGVDVDMECHTNPKQPTRGKGCAWVWTRTAEQQAQLLAVNKELLVDVHESGQYLQLVVTDSLMRMLPHLAPHSTPSSIPSLEGVSEERRVSLHTPHHEWLLPRGPVTVEVPVPASSPQRHQPRFVRQQAQPSLPRMYRHNPYDDKSAVTFYQ